MSEPISQPDLNLSNLGASNLNLSHLNPSNPSPLNSSNADLSSADFCDAALSTPKTGAPLPALLLPYGQLCDRVKPGDVFAFSGYDLPSTVVKVATKSDYVHVAIALALLPDQNPQDPILIAESHIDTKLPSFGTGDRHRGVQFQWLSQRITASQGPVWWAALKQPLSVRGLSRMQRWLQTLEHQQVPYDYLQAIAAGLGRLEGLTWLSQSSATAMFCSEMVTGALQLAGIVDADVNASEQLPIDVMQFPCFQEPILIRE